MTGVTVGERILVHLSTCLRHADAYECPPEMTQDGIATALGISRAHVALELKRLRTRNRVEERMAHVAGAKVRRKVYALTPAGQDIARRMREHARTKTVTLVGPAGTSELRGEDALAVLRKAGMRESEALQRIIAGGPVALRPPEPPRPTLPPGRPFFGREAEARTLRTFLSVDPQPAAVVLGVAGAGKTALLAHVLGGEPRPHLLRRLYAHDDAHGLLCSCADFLAHVGRRRLKTVLAKPAYDPVEALAVLRQDLDGCVLAFDDYQACPAAEGLLRSLLEEPPRFKIIVASRVQPTFYDRSAIVDGSVIEITLAGLDPASAADLLASRGALLDSDGLRLVLRATQGHPLALELFAASGLEAGRAETERFILETVLDGLDDVSEGLLRAFAVLRRPARSPESLGATVAQLRRLLRKAVLQHREDGYVLHDLVKEFFLERMPPHALRAAHARAAGYWRGRDDALEEAYHWIEAGAGERAAALLEANGDAYAESARAGDLEACLLRLPSGRCPRTLLAETQMFLGKFDEAKAVLRTLAAAGGPSERLRARIQLGRIAHRQGAFEDARTVLAEAASEARDGDEANLEGEALRALGGVERRLGRFEEALDHLRRAVALLDHNPREKARALTDLGAALIAMGDLAVARARLEEALPLARKGSREEAAILNNLGIVLSREGDTRKAASRFERSVELALGTGEVRFASTALANAVDNLLRLGALEAATACAERALSLAGTTHDPMALSTARANLGLVFARQGEWAKAEKQLLESVDLIARLDNPYSLASRYEEIARVYEAQGRDAEATPWRERADGLLARVRPAAAMRTI